MKSKRSPWYDEKMILRLSNCFQVLNIKKECCEIHQETQFQIDFFLFLQNKKMTTENKNDRDWMILKIYERLRKHREIRIWDILQWMDDNDYYNRTCPVCFRHIVSSTWWEFRCKKCKDNRLCRETTEILLEVRNKKKEILENQSTKCIRMIFEMIFIK